MRARSVPSATLIEKCCLVACPVAGNPTQYLVEQAFALKGLDWRFMTFEVEPPRLGDAMRGIRALGFHGVKIGEPFQESVIEHLDGLSERAKKCGSVNCITTEGERLVGDNTEGAALVELARQQANLVGKRAMVVGAGRLARAIAVALADAGVTNITVACRSAEKGDQLVELIGQQTAASATLVPLSGALVTVDPEIAVLVNATSLSTLDAAAKLPLDAASLGPKLSSPTWPTTRRVRGSPGKRPSAAAARSTASRSSSSRRPSPFKPGPACARHGLDARSGRGIPRDLSSMNHEHGDTDDSRCSTHRDAQRNDSTLLLAFLFSVLLCVLRGESLLRFRCGLDDKGLFITGTGTGVGKDLCRCADRARAAQQRGSESASISRSRVAASCATASWFRRMRSRCGKRPDGPGRLEQVCPQRFAAAVGASSGRAGGRPARRPEAAARRNRLSGARRARSCSSKAPAD